MSCFVVNEKHIDVLLNYGNLKDIRILLNDRVYDFSQTDDLNEIGQMLLNMNYKAFNTRYKCDVVDVISDEYSFNSLNMTHKPVEIIKACKCYEYQACETNDYKGSNASKIINLIKNTAIINLEGYNEAQWEIN